MENHISSTSISNKIEALKINPNYVRLISHLKEEEYIQSPEVENVMLSIDRADFCPENPYQDGAQYINYGATISAPHMHAIALEWLKDHLIKGKKALDIGSGTGYLTLAFAKLMKEDSKAYGIEHIPELVQLSLKNINKNHSSYLETKKVEIYEADGRVGLATYAPYDAIHVGAAVESIPKELIDQLACGGRLVLPVGKPGLQWFTIVDKGLDGKITQNKALAVAYIPLTAKTLQWPKA